MLALTISAFFLYYSLSVNIEQSYRAPALVFSVGSFIVALYLAKGGILPILLSVTAISIITSAPVFQIEWKPLVEAILEVNPYPEIDPYLQALANYFERENNSELTLVDLFHVLVGLAILLIVVPLTNPRSNEPNSSTNIERQAAQKVMRPFIRESDPPFKILLGLILVELPVDIKDSIFNLLKHWQDKPESTYSESEKRDFSGIIERNDIKEFVGKNIDDRQAGQVLFSGKSISHEYSSGFSLSIKECITLRGGSVVGLVGPNGSGKTTLLKIIAGIIAAKTIEKEPPNLQYNLQKTEGIDTWEQRKAQISYLAQTPEPFQYSPYQELRLLAGLRGVKRKDQVSYVEGLLHFTNAYHLKDRKWNQLSGGEKTRVSLARALCGFPEILILDEPLAALDPKALSEFLLRINIYAKVASATVLFSSQNVYEAETIADEMWYMSNGSLLNRLETLSGSLYEIVTRKNANLGFSEIKKLLEGRNKIEVNSFGESFIINSEDKLSFHELTELFKHSKDIVAVRDLSESIMRMFIND